MLKLFRRFLTSGDPTEEEAKAFIEDATVNKDKIIQENTDKIIHDLRKDMDKAIHYGRTHIHVFFSDIDYEYDGMYDPERIIAWLKKWERFEGFHFHGQNCENPFECQHCKLQWELR